MLQLGNHALLRSYVSFPELLRLYNEDCRQRTMFIGSQYGGRTERLRIYAYTRSICQGRSIG